MKKVLIILTLALGLGAAASYACDRTQTTYWGSTICWMKCKANNCRKGFDIVNGGACTVCGGKGEIKEWEVGGK